MQWATLVAADRLLDLAHIQLLMLAGPQPAPASASLPPDVFSIISRLLLDTASRASLFATCTAARDGVLSNCRSIQVTLVGSDSGLTQRARFLNRAISRGLIRAEALRNITLKLQVRPIQGTSCAGRTHVMARMSVNPNICHTTIPGPTICCNLHLRGCTPGVLKHPCLQQLYCLNSKL
jgi:hypothetical protein